MPVLKATEIKRWIWKKKNDLKKNSIYSFYCVSQSKILIDATIPFQIKPWEYEEMKNSDEKVNIGALRDVK